MGPDATSVGVGPSVLPEGTVGCAGSSACRCIADSSVKLGESRQLLSLIFSDEEVIS